MKISEFTIEVLKNYSTINMGLLIKPGNKLRTCSVNRSVMAEAVIDETFDREIGVYDLNKLLALLSMKKGDPEMEVEDSAFAFKGIGNGKIRMRFTFPNILIVPPEKNPSPEFPVKFEITQEVLNWINNVASILKCPNFVFRCEGGEIVLWALDVKGAITDDASINLGSTSKEVFEAVFNISNMRIIPGSYEVELAPGMIKCTHKTKKITYWIAMENKRSSFGKK